MTIVVTSLSARFSRRAQQVVRRIRAAVVVGLTLALVLPSAATVSAQATRTVTAVWDRNTDAVTAGYIAYYGTSSGNYQWSYDAGNQVSAALTLAEGSIYYVSVRAYNAAAELGPLSNEATINLSGPAPPAPTATITATLQNATTALVSWQTTDAVSATLNGTAVGLTGSTPVTIAATTTFTLVATSASGATATQSATVTITPAPAPTAQITAVLETPTTARLTWQTTNAVSAQINGMAVGLTGASTVPITATTTYTLIATSASGATATKSATVTVAPPAAPTAQITATLQAGGTTALVSWQTTNAIDASINGTPVPLTGSATVAVAAPTTFTLVARSSSGATATQSATVTPATPPTLPSAPTSMAAVVRASRATLTWQAPTTGAAPNNYLLYVGTLSGGSNIANGSAVGNVLTVAGDLPKGRYYARVRAANGAGMSGDSNEAFFKIGRSLISPLGFTVRWEGTTAVLSWIAPVADRPAVEDQPTSYLLEAGTAPGRSDIGSLSVGNVTTFRADVPAGTFYVRVRAENAFGDSEPTEDLVLTPPGAPGAPRNLASPGSGSTVELRWTAPTGPPPTGYLIEAGSAPGRSDLAVLQVGAVTSFSAPAPPPGTYYVRVRAINARGSGQPSNEVIVRR